MLKKREQPHEKKEKRFRVFYKIHEKGNERIFALCDAELLGKTLREKETVIDLARFRSFYEGKKINAEQAKKELKKCTSANLIGKKAVKIAVDMGLASEKNVKRIQGVPHVQIYKIKAG